jgi:hypothetical protein
MKDQELIDWIKQVKNNDKMPADTNQRMLRIIQILVERTEPKKQGRPKLSLNKGNAA